jgi:tyrosine-protein phosphatase SIW14
MKIVSCFLLLALCSSAPAKLREFYRIDDHIYRGRQPKRSDYPTLAQMGFKTVLDLRGGPIHKPRERKQVEAAGMQYISMRLSGFWEPHDRQMAAILAVMEDPARWPIFMHCRRGDDRLGEAIACYRMVHDHWTNQQAFEEAKRDGMSRFEVLMRRYIRHFNPAAVIQAENAAQSLSLPPSTANAGSTLPGVPPAKP